MQGKNDSTRGQEHAQPTQDSCIQQNNDVIDLAVDITAGSSTTKKNEPAFKQIEAVKTDNPNSLFSRSIKDPNSSSPSPQQTYSPSPRQAYSPFNKK